MAVNLAFYLGILASEDGAAKGRSAIIWRPELGQ